MQTADQMARRDPIATSIPWKMEQTITDISQIEHDTPGLHLSHSSTVVEVCIHHREVNNPTRRWLRLLEVVAQQILQAIQQILAAITAR